MKRWLLPLSALVLAAPLFLLAKPQAGETRTVALNGHTFTLPAGFDIELVAGPPLVDRPISIDFDEDGRLYVADSSGSNENVNTQLQKKPHRILRLEDTDGDGKFDRKTVFADKMMFPEGTMWFAGSLYVAAVPQIWKLTDTDGDGVADKREVWFDGKTMTGCANDLHGPYRGPDGWIYWCKGAFAKQTYEQPGKAPFHTRAAHVFRARPDGSGVEAVMTGGMDNPVDLVFTPGGERIFTTTFLQFPAGGKRDGLIHAVYGGIYGKDWEVIHEPQHKWTGPSVLPVMTHLGPAAPCGLHRYESNAFGADYQDNLFACQFNLQKVSRHVLIPDGATFKTRDSDFVVSSSKDFHPTDVIEDADGSLLIVDTGGWYKLCCPTSQLVKPDVLGGIYRVRKQGAPKIGDPRGRKLAWATMSAPELVMLLDDPRPAVRRRAIETLAAKGEDAVPALGEASKSAEAKRNAVWTATRIDTPGARALVRGALGDRDESVRQAASHSAGLWRDRGAVAPLVNMIRKFTPLDSRSGAEALGRIGDETAVPALLDNAAWGGGPMLDHSRTYALIEIGDRRGVALGLASANGNVTRSALLALEQMHNGKLKAEDVTLSLDSDQNSLREAAWWVASRHPEWADVLGAHLQKRLAKPQAAEERRDLVGQLAKLAKAPAIQALLAESLRDAKAPVESHRLVLAAMGEAALKDTPASWFDAIAEVLAGKEKATLPDAVAAARALRMPKQPPEKFVAALHRLGGDPAAADAVRLNALVAIPGGLAKVDPLLFAFLRGRLRPDEPVASRMLAADVLAKAKLSAPQLITLADALKEGGPMEVNRLLETFGQSGDEKVGLAFVAGLNSSHVKSGLRPEAIKPHLKKYGPAVRKQADELFATLATDSVKERAKLEALVSQVKDGDVRRGQAVFNSQKAACMACHTIGYVGGKIGPDLTRIGSIRTEQDLLESIVFPSASLVRGYEPFLVVTASGKQHNGLLKKDTADEIVLVTGADQEVRIPRRDIDEIQPSRVSVMPAGLDQQLSPRELADLVAFLRACK